MCSSARLAAGLLFVALLAPAAASAIQHSGSPQSQPHEYEAYLVTYGPGEIYWQRFGHNAIWLKEPARGLDHSFNFGFFDLQQENFLLRFVQGRMLYFSLARPVAHEMAYYEQHKRSIRAQRLDLDPAQYARLRDHLLEQVRPENRDYLYDYYLDNCSTRLRDALDVALQGALATEFKAQTASLNFRDHTRRSTAEEYWYYLGLELALGMPIDRPVNRWQEMFLPAVLADALSEFTLRGPEGATALVSGNRVLFQSPSAPPDELPPMVWPRYLLLSLSLLALGWLAARALGPVLVEGYTLAWMLIAGTLGMAMVAVWLWTDHHAANPNANLLLLNPMMVLALVPALRKAAAGVIAVGLAGAAVVLAMPDWQYTTDVFALLAPLNAVSAYRLWKSKAPAKRVIRDW